MKQRDYLLMAARPKPIRAARGGMFGFAAAHPLTPELERGSFHMLPHKNDHLRLGESELKFNRLEGGAVFPSHFNDPIEVFAGECCQRRAEHANQR